MISLWNLCKLAVLISLIKSTDACKRSECDVISSDDESSIAPKYTLKDYFKKMALFDEKVIENKFDAFQTSEKPYQKTTMVLTKAEIKKCRNYKRSNLYEKSRFKLSGTSTFINASHMGTCDYDRPYIATQSPIPESFADFWRMIFESRSGLIVDLAQLGITKQSEKYWPDHTIRSISFNNGIVVIFKRKTEIIPKLLIKRQFVVVKDDEEVEVSHLHYSGWPDMGLPDEKSFRKLVEVSTRGVPKDRPTVVHCSSGVGRTGTYLTINHLISLERQNDLDLKKDYVLDIVKRFRMQRRGMVETSSQFLMIHKFFFNRYRL